MALLRALDRRHAEKPRQDARHLDDGDLVLAAKRVLAGEPHDEVERLVRHLGKRVRGVQAHGQQQGLHFALKELLDPAALARVALTVGHQLDALLLQQGQQFVVVDGVLLRHEGVHLGGQLFVGFDGVQAALLMGLVRVELGRHAHLEELVEVAGNDAQVAQAFQQGDIGSARPVHHPLVESQDAVVSVQKSQAGLGVAGAHENRGYQGMRQGPAGFGCVHVT
ncbi:hypothetical protein Y695_03623 [Hydrogenophaga sp. T4]|nr:hypothetical protein Y695_03623 [Hydrogenophaga sp. T4]